MFLNSGSVENSGEKLQLRDIQIRGKGIYFKLPFNLKKEHWKGKPCRDGASGIQAYTMIKGTLQIRYFKKLKKKKYFVFVLRSLSLV